MFGKASFWRSIVRMFRLSFYGHTYSPWALRVSVVGPRSDWRRGELWSWWRGEIKFLGENISAAVL